MVDTRPERRQLVRHLVESTGLAVPGIAEADNKAGALELLDHYDADVVVLDIQMPVEEGLNTIAALRGRSPRLRIVVCSFHHEVATKERALAQGADAYLDKPVGAADLKRALQRLSEEPPPGSRGQDGLTTANPDSLAVWSPSATSDQRRWWWENRPAPDITKEERVERTRH